MDENPYQSPEADLGPADNEPSTRPAAEIAAWRDGHLIVVRRSNGQPPYFCIKTGEVVPDLTPLTLTWPAPSFLERRFGFGLTLERQTFHVGISSRWEARRRILILLFLAACVVFGGCNAIRLTAIDPGQSQPSLDAAVLVFLCGIGMCGALSIWLESPMKVRASSAHFVWLSGAKEGFLKRLPPLKPHQSPPG